MDFLDAINGAGDLGGGFGSPAMPPELQKAMNTLENMDERLGKLSVPLLKLQYTCGFKSCFQSSLESSSSWGSTSFLGGGSSSAALDHGGHNPQATLSCIERCEAPMTEFSQACETRLDGLMNKVTQCFTSNMDESGAEKCVRDALGDSNLRQVEDALSLDVQNIYQKYQTGIN
ncbi:unnamed protein product [Amoebophrya sp. A120]|nr:unnamed protein product [Amoebophrya sp. A120]|eukprot:GSA120T00023173001.1